MIKRLGIIFTIISVLFLFSCGIPSIYVPVSSDISITSDSVYINTSTLNSSLLRSGSPYLNIYYQIVPEGLTPQYPYSTINNKFISDYCNETSGRNINKRNGSPFYKYDYTTSINDTSATLTYGLYQFVDAKTNSTINIPINGLDSLVSNNWNYNLSINDDNYLELTIETASGNVTYNLARYNGSSFSNSNTPYITNEIPSEYAYSNDITNYQLRVYALVTLQFNNYNNIYNSKPVEIFNVSLGLTD